MKFLTLGLILSILLIPLGMILIAILAIETNSAISLTPLILVFIGLIGLCYFESRIVTWKCTICGYEFKVGMFEFMFGINAGNSKLFFCKKCNTKCTCISDKKKK